MSEKRYTDEELTAAITNARAAARADEREECAKIALAIDSGRGNEKEIARAIRARI